MGEEAYAPRAWRLSYSFTTVDVPGSLFTSVLQIDSSGEAIGTYRDPKAFDHIFVYENGTYTTLDVPGTSGTGGVPNAGINNTGVIAGNYYNGTEHGFTYASGTFTTINVPGATDTYVTGINNSGQLTGYYLGPTVSGGFIYDNGAFTTIPSAFYPAINDRGEIVGEYLPTGSEQGFIYKDGVLTTFSAPGAISTLATAVNDRGVVSGNYLGSDNTSYGFIYQNGNFTPIDIPGSRAIDVTSIDNHNDVVGWYEDTLNHEHGFVDIKGKITTIDVPDSVDTEILGINAQGQLVGLYDNSSGDQYGFIADPSGKPSVFTQPDLSDLLQDFGRHIGIYDFFLSRPPREDYSVARGSYAAKPTPGSGGPMYPGLSNAGMHTVLSNT